MTRLYSNENFPIPVVTALRELGHDVLTSVEAGTANQAIPDDEVLDFAGRDDRSVITLNRLHFVLLHGRRAAQHEGIVVCSLDTDFPGMANRIHDALAIHNPLKRKLLRVNRGGFTVG